MQYHEQYGQQVLQHKYKTKNAKVYMAVSGLVLVVLGVLAVAVFMFANPEFFDFSPDEPISKVFPIILLLLCLLVLFRIPKISKTMRTDTEGILYENGIVLTLFNGTGPHTRKLECGFDEIKGIKHYIVKYSYGFVPSGKQQKFIVHLKNKYQAYTGNSSVKSINLNKDNYHLAGIYPSEFLAKLLDMYTNYLVRDLTKENITQSKMTFGENLELSDGQFIYKGGQTILSLNTVSRITSDKLPLMDSKINIRNVDEKGKEKKTISLPITEAMNVDALYYIINNFA